MRRKIPIAYLFLTGTFISLFCLPFSFSSHLRHYTLGFLLPVTSYFTKDNSDKIYELEQKIVRLGIENSRLRDNSSSLVSSKDILSARVIYRTYAAWQNFLWIDIGENRAPYNLKNAPVLVDGIVVGIIEEVGLERSRVRLVTDPHLIPSVRAMRKGVLLAKGELRGARKSTFRTPGQILHGTGFNYDFPDQESDSKALTPELIQAGDLLVTTGFDGVFPKGLKVAEVTKVIPLKEGDFYYEIEAESLIKNLNSFETVHLLPPIR